jgi:uncharacterized coiled-coil protein SlyX
LAAPTQPLVGIHSVPTQPAAATRPPGAQALELNTTGEVNTAIGGQALEFNSTGKRNVAIGVSALGSNTTGSDNIALGQSAGYSVRTGDNNIDIGNKGGAADEDNTIRIGDRFHTRTFIAGISGAAVMGAAVHVNAAGQLGTSPSSARFKQEIKPMEKASEAILSLKPVTFHYRKEVDPDGVPQFGLVAEDVEKVNPDLVARDGEGKPYSVRYEVVNAMLLNEFLKEHRKVEEQDHRIQQQEATITQLKSTVAKQEAAAAKQQKQIEVLTPGLQKVSAQVEMSKPAL